MQSPPLPPPPPCALHHQTSSSSPNVDTSSLFSPSKIYLKQRLSAGSHQHLPLNERFNFIYNSGGQADELNLERDHDDDGSSVTDAFITNNNSVFLPSSTITTNYQRIYPSRDVGNFKINDGIYGIFALKSSTFLSLSFSYSLSSVWNIEFVGNLEFYKINSNL
jgi:hypothetical protein